MKRKVIEAMKIMIILMMLMIMEVHAKRQLFNMSTKSIVKTNTLERFN